MKLLHTIVLTVLLSSASYAIPLEDVAWDNLSAFKLDEDYYDNDYEDVTFQISTPCVSNCTCTSRLGNSNSNIEINCNNRDMQSIPVPHDSFAIFIKLDFAWNKLVTLGNDTFKDYPTVEQIVLYWNEITDVDIDAFNGLQNLKEVDLSDNYITYVHPDIFKGNPNLEKVILSDNPLFEVSGKTPILNAPTLSFLDLRECRLSYLMPESFTNLKSLRTLDLSSNYLESLSINTLSQMEELQYVNLNHNRWTCDCQLQTLLEYTYELRPKDLIEERKPVQCIDSMKKVWTFSNYTNNCKTQSTSGSTTSNILSETSNNPEPILSQVSEEIEIEVIYVHESIPLPESTADSISEEKAMVFGSIIFYLQHNSQSVYAIIILIAIVITTIILSVVCLKIVLNSRSEQTDNENQKKKNLMLSFGVEFEDKRSSFVPLLDPSSGDFHGQSTPPNTNLYANPKSLFEEYVNSGRPLHVNGINK